jgi:acyl carrier protein
VKILRHATESRIKRVMADVLGIDQHSIDEGTSMDGVAAWDSLSHIQLCVGLEQEFDVSLDVAEIEHMVSYRKIVEILQPKVAEI